MIKLVISTDAVGLASFAVFVVSVDPLWRTDLLPLQAQANGLSCTGRGCLLRGSAIDVSNMYVSPACMT